LDGQGVDRSQEGGGAKTHDEALGDGVIKEFIGFPGHRPILQELSLFKTKVFTVKSREGS
jgi:hypothetical protein